MYRKKIKNVYHGGTGEREKSVKSKVQISSQAQKSKWKKPN
jgi:hypothetical protein